MSAPVRRRRPKFLGSGGTRRGQGARDRVRLQEQLFDDPDDRDDASSMFDVGELERDVNRMRLETSSNVYAQRRSTW